MKRVIQELEIGIDPEHSTFLVYGRRDLTLAEILTTLSAYLVLILQKEKVEGSEKLAPELILGGYIENNFIHIEMPPQMNGGSQVWKIPINNKQGIIDFFLEKICPPLN
ncbi:MAG: hypothetical protein V3574_03805 [Candidatus Moraniibacteriota bacterium]